MQRTTKIVLISSASVLGSAVISGLSYIKGKADGFKLGVQAAKNQELGTGTQQNQGVQPNAARA